MRRPSEDEPHDDVRERAFVLPPPRRGGSVAVVLGWLTAAALAVTWGSAFAAASGHDLPWPALALVSALPYLAVAGITWTFVLWTFFPDRGLPPWLLAAATVAPLVLWGPSWRQSAEPGDGTAVRVMTWNARRLWGGPDDGGNPRACIVREVLAAHPDVLAFQELTRQDLDALTVDLGLSCAWDTYRARSAESKRSGLAVCVRNGWQLDRGTARTYSDGDDWQFIDAVASHEGRSVRVLGVHLSSIGVLEDPVNRLDDALRRMPQVFRTQASQGRALTAFARAAPGPLVIAGDFNGTRDTPVHAGLRTVLRDAWEVAGDGFGGTVSLLGILPLRIDHVYASEALSVASVEVPPAGCSDHRPVVTDLHIRP